MIGNKILESERKRQFAIWALGGLVLVILGFIIIFLDGQNSIIWLTFILAGICMSMAFTMWIEILGGKRRALVYISNSDFECVIEFPHKPADGEYFNIKGDWIIQRIGKKAEDLAGRRLQIMYTMGPAETDYGSIPYCFYWDDKKGK